MSGKTICAYLDLRYLDYMYRVTQKVSDLGWVYIYLECSTILLGQ